MGVALLWPVYTETNVLMRLVLIIDGGIIGWKAGRNVRYRMTKTKVPNSEFPLLI